MRRKLLITTAAIIVSACSITGGTMAVYSAATHTDKTISTSSIGVRLNVNGDIKDTVNDNYATNGMEKKITSDYEISQRVSTQNTGTRPQYVRVKVTKEWFDNNETITQKNGRQLNSDYIGINYINTEDWIYVDGDNNNENNAGYLYYKKMVYPGENTTDFMDAYTVLKDVDENTNVYSNLSAKVDYEADAIQTVAAKAAMVYEWGVVPEFDESGNIVKLVDMSESLMMEGNNILDIESAGNDITKSSVMLDDEQKSAVNQNILDEQKSAWNQNVQDDEQKSEENQNVIADKLYETMHNQNVNMPVTDGTVITLDSSATHFGVVDKDIEFQNMEPGETREGMITLFNNSDKAMDYYISSELMDNIADAGSGKGIYNIKIYKSCINPDFDNDNENEYSLLYDGDIESYKNNILVSEQKLATLSAGDNVVIRISVTLDGRTMDNSYMNKEGRMRINISAVQSDDGTDNGGETTVKTGDDTRLAVYGVIAIIAGVSCIGLIAGTYSRKRNMKNVNDTK